MSSIGEQEIYECYNRSPYLSIKHSSYFQVYADLLSCYRNKPFVFVEIGVLNGGSLFMWRDYFGPHARIIGIDVNPTAKEWESNGFEIFIGDQADPDFWKRFFGSVPSVDVILDDGGHTFEQQISTVHNCIPRVADGGLIIVEDTHTSYFREFGYPTRYSFIEWSKKILDNINCRFPAVKINNMCYKNSVYSIRFFESIVAFQIDRQKCFESSPTSNGGASTGAYDARLCMQEEARSAWSLGSFSQIAFFRRSKFLRMIKHRVSDYVIQSFLRYKLRNLRRYFE